jgi:hypothetical protein
MGSIRLGEEVACEPPRIVEALRTAVGISRLEVMVTAPWRQEPAGWARVTFGHLASFLVRVFFYQGDVQGDVRPDHGWRPGHTVLA